MHGEVGEGEEQAYIGRLGRWRSRPAVGGWGGRGAGLQSEVEEQACRGRWRSRPAVGGGGTGLQGIPRIRPCQHTQQKCKGHFPSGLT